MIDIVPQETAGQGTPLQKLLVYPARRYSILTQSIDEKGQQFMLVRENICMDLLNCELLQLVFDIFMDIIPHFHHICSENYILSCCSFYTITKNHIYFSNIGMLRCGRIGANKYWAIFQDWKT